MLIDKQSTWQVSSSLGEPTIVLLIWPRGVQQDGAVPPPGSTDPAAQYSDAMANLQDQVNPA